MGKVTRARWANKEIIRALELFAQGLTHEAIGEHLGRTHFSVDGLMRDLRQRRTHADFWGMFDTALLERDKQILNGAQRFRWSVDLDTLLMRLTREGQSDSAIARQLGVSRSAIKMRRFKIRERQLDEGAGAFADPVLALVPPDRRVGDGGLRPRVQRAVHRRAAGQPRPTRPHPQPASPPLRCRVRPLQRTWRSTNVRPDDQAKTATKNTTSTGQAAAARPNPSRWPPPWATTWRYWWE